MKPDKKMKICHIITRMVIGGAQENTLFTCLDHLKKGHEVVLLTGPSLGREGDLLERLQIEKTTSLRVIHTPFLVRELDLINDAKALSFIYKFLKQEKFDVFHTHASKAGILGRIAARWAKTPVVVHTVHGQPFHVSEKPWKNFIYKASEWFAAFFCDRIYAVAQAMIDQCVAAKIAPRNKYMVVYSGMDIDNFLNSKYDEKLAAELGINRDKIVIGSVARLFEFKGYEYFIPAALELAKKYDNVEFLIVGDGKMYDEILAQIKATPYSERFHFAGLVSPDQVYRYISLMDILWHFSQREGLPRAVVQALASGVTAMGFNLDGTPEVIINDESGFLIEYKHRDLAANLPMIIEKSSLLIENDKLRIKFGENGRKLVAEKFAHEYMSEVLEREYASLLELKQK
ncbi:MAG: glycosyltransferase family 4 protein [Lentisphaeria bacterium]|nr:glycosyltransferase family 4 protein [Lentisphaeria bacterium]